VRVFVLTRHAESLLNHERRVNGDPTVMVGLTELGSKQAAALGAQLAHFPFDVCVHTRFPRTRITAELALTGRDVPLAEERLLDDIDIGDLEGATIEEYRAWRREHDRDTPFPGGESPNDAARRYAEAYRRILESPHGRVLVVMHEIPLRYALNAASGSRELDGPTRNIENTVPFVLGEAAFTRAAAGIDRLAGETI
jgi:broad specificity phosphatase PhoE